jgi:hypothetical protein
MFISPDADGNEAATDTSRALGMASIGWLQSADTMSDWVVESMQEIVSKLNKAERRFIPTPDVYNIRLGILSSTLTGDKLQQDVRNWLSPPDPWKNHHLARESRHGGTGTWWVEGDTYAEWKFPGANSLLWIHGKRPYFALYSFL